MKSFSLVQQNDIEPEVTLIKKCDNAIVFHVKNGKGLLNEKQGEFDNNGLSCLLFNNIPLIKFHGNASMCRTCDKLISAGYGLDQSEENQQILSELNDQLNSPFVSIEQSFNDLKPLLGLLPTGHYQLSDEALFPTNGDGKFFWCLDNTPTINYATSGFYEYGNSSVRFSEPFPKYLLPSQSPNRLNMERVRYYQSKTNLRAIAYYHDSGYLCTLIDGHHKATAAALNGQSINTLVISDINVMMLWGPDQDKRLETLLTGSASWDDNTVEYIDPLRGYHDARDIDKVQTEAIFNLKNTKFDNYPWSDELTKTANNYYDAAMWASLHFAGDITDNRLLDILSGEEQLDDSALEHIINALFITNHDMAETFAISSFKRELDIDTLISIFMHLSKSKSSSVSNFFSDFLINDDGETPLLTQIIDDYFRI